MKYHRALSKNSIYQNEKMSQVDKPGFFPLSFHFNLFLDYDLLL